MLTISVYTNAEKTNLILPILGIFAASAFRIIPSLNRILGAFQIIKYYSYTTGIVSNDLSNQVNNDISKTNYSSSNEVLFNKEIILKDINFKYEDTEELVFNNLNMKINKNDFIAITEKLAQVNQL